MTSLTARRLPLVAFVATALFYLPFASGGFYTDDFPHVEHVRNAAGLGSLLLRPDTFGFYRPLTQLALYMDWRIYGDWAPGFRLTNILLHAGVMALVALTTQRLTRHVRTASLTTLAFGLALKAHPIAVLWASARAEILMSLFALLAVIGWLRWRESGRWTPLAVSAAAYALSLLSKETVAALPLLVIFLGPARTTRRDIGAAAALAAVGAIVVYGRTFTGALMPWSPDPHYQWLLRPTLWIHDADNYLRRGGIAPAVLLVLVALPAWCRFARHCPRARSSRRRAGIGWFRATMIRCSALRRATSCICTARTAWACSLRTSRLLPSAITPTRCACRSQARRSSCSLCKRRSARGSIEICCSPAVSLPRFGRRRRRARSTSR
jgi:hypothetical protein